MKFKVVSLLFLLGWLSSCSNQLRDGIMYVKDDTNLSEETDPQASAFSGVGINILLPSGYYEKASTQVTGFSLKEPNSNISISCAVDEYPSCPPDENMNCSNIPLDTNQDEVVVKALECVDDIPVSNYYIARYSFIDFIEHWETYGNIPFSESYLYNITLKVYDGVVYVAYRDNSASQKATVVKYNETLKRWEYVGHKGFSSGVAYDLSFDISDDGELYVAYRDGANSEKATVMFYNDSTSSWEIKGVAGFSSGRAYNTKLDVYNNVPYVLYRDSNYSYKLVLKKYNIGNGKWDNIGTLGFSPGGVYNLNLVIHNDIPYVAFRDYAVNGRATVMYYSLLGWQILGNQGFSDSYTNEMTLALDSMGTPYVAYQDNSISNKITVMRYNGTDWVPVTHKGVYENPGGNLNFKIYNDTLFIAFTDQGYNNKITLIKYQDYSWQIVAQAAFTDRYSYYPSLDVYDSKPYVAYQSNSMSGRGMVKVACPPSPSKPLPNIVGGYYINNDILQITLTTDTPNSKIYYTLDGTIPDETSTLYTGAIPITAVDDSVNLQAVAYNELADNLSPILSETYTFTP